MSVIYCHTKWAAFFNVVYYRALYSHRLSNIFAFYSLGSKNFLVHPFPLPPFSCFPFLFPKFPIRKVDYSWWWHCRYNTFDVMLYVCSTGFYSNTDLLSLLYYSSPCFLIIYARPSYKNLLLDIYNLPRLLYDLNFLFVWNS